MRKYIDILEDINLDLEDDDDAFSQAMDREKHIEKLIRFAFDKIKLPISYNNYAVSYEDSTREAEVTIEDISVNLSQLKALEATGLATGDYKIEWGSEALRIAFIVSPALDAAQIG